MAIVRFTDIVTGKVHELTGETYRKAKSLFNYSIRVATRATKIELIIDSKIVDQHVVVFEETIPSVLGMGRRTR